MCGGLYRERAGQCERTEKRGADQPSGKGGRKAGTGQGGIQRSDRGLEKEMIYLFIGFGFACCIIKGTP